MDISNNLFYKQYLCQDMLVHLLLNLISILIHFLQSIVFLVNHKWFIMVNYIYYVSNHF